MYFIGDVHGKFDQYYKLIENLPKSIQVGDMGIGFVDYKPISNHYFIHGNHDNPDECGKFYTFLGRWGYFENIFFVSGARSIDERQRTIGIDWWSNEELSYLEGCQMLADYQGADIIVSHDCPLSIYPRLGIRKPNKSLTASLLDVLLEHKLKPKTWVFGHHHKSRNIWHNGVNFICLNELEIVPISY